MISTRSTKRGVIEIYPKFIIKKSSDLMIRGGDFYAIWNEERGLWSTDEQVAIQLIDKELDIFAAENKSKFDGNVKVLHLWDAETGMIDSFHKYCQKQLRDSFHMLDEKLIFANSGTNKKDYASKRLNYPLVEGEFPAYELLMSTLYLPEERHKLEWAIGAIVTGDSKKIQKFLVLYGAAGTGKSTIINIIQALFDGYCAVFDAKALGQASSAFALEPFKTNPLVAIQHDGDLSRIEDNTRLNSLVSHEEMTVNEKHKSMYSNRFKAFLIMGTNKPVKITDAKSGLLRRLIDVTPSGNKLDSKEYRHATKQVAFELGPIASHCKEVYLADPSAYDDYIPLSMMGASNDFYNFVVDSVFAFTQEDGITLKRAYELYKNYCDEAKVPYPLSRMIFKEELKNYFTEYNERVAIEDGTRVRSYYSGFRMDKINGNKTKKETKKKDSSKLIFKEQPSKFDEYCKDCLSQYASAKETPQKKWDEVTTTLADISTDKLHYVKIPENHIVIDFDIPDESGKKSFEKNLEAASKWPLTYAELSKSGQGIHLHYIYDGDVSRLSRMYEDHVEIKVFSGKSSLRRKLTKCNDIPIATISSGLPLKEEKKTMIDTNIVITEKELLRKIEKALRKEYENIPPHTAPIVSFIKHILDEAYESGVTYDVRCTREAIKKFSDSSTNQKEQCRKMFYEMHFMSDDISDTDELNKIPVNVLAKKPVVYYDIEVFPNLILCCWKIEGLGKPIVKMINPTPDEVEEFLNNCRLRGFNCRRYDNHIMYGRMMGYNNEQVYKQSKGIIDGNKNCFFREGYNVSETDIYDFASAGNKKSLKKLEIEMGNLSKKDLQKAGYSDEDIEIIMLGTHHQELGIPWDQPVPEDKWELVADYCCNDVLATEAAFTYLKADWTARQILADLAEMTVNDSTNSLTMKIIFGNNRKPQSEFCYRNLAEPVFTLDPEVKIFLEMACPDMMKYRHGEAGSLLPYFPGYKYEKGVSTYRGEEVGEGGYVYAEPGMYSNVALLDIASMHPHSTIAECLFGVRYTTAYRDIVEGRVSIKHEAWDIVDGMLEGKLRPYIQRVKNGEITSGQLANALKTAINSVYGLTSAKFENPFRDTRNVDNIVAKRGALFMIDLKHEVQKRGFTVAHIKTDSIKIPNATPEIIQFVMEFGKKYGYSFEHEATYEKMCLVNNAVYIAKYKDGKHAGEWTATGTQFAVPYVFKTLFSHEPITFNDMCETFAVSKGDLYLDMNEDLVQLTREESKELDDLDKAWHADNSEAMDKVLKKYHYDAEYAGERYSDLCRYEMDSHNYHFVGRVGQFCPIKEGSGGGVLYRCADGKYYAAANSTGYRWLESEVVKQLNKEKDIDKRFYEELVENAITDISQYGDFEWFTSDDSEVDLPWNAQK